MSSMDSLVTAVRRCIVPAQVLWSPGRGIPPRKQEPFTVLDINDAGIRIDKLGQPILFQHIEYAIHRIANWGNIVPIGSRQGWAEHETLEWALQVARGNNTRTATYVAPILVETGLARYVMLDRQKGIAL